MTHHSPPERRSPDAEPPGDVVAGHPLHGGGIAHDDQLVGGAAPEEGAQGRRYYVTGGIVLDVEVFTTANVQQRPRVLEAILVHELAHVVGLGHVAEPMELMFVDNSGQVELGPGDREGLARLGSVPCG